MQKCDISWKSIFYGYWKESFGPRLFMGIFDRSLLRLALEMAMIFQARIIDPHRHEGDSSTTHHEKYANGAVPNFLPQRTGEILRRNPLLKNSHVTSLLLQMWRSLPNGEKQEF
jgi:hypothetical protein